MRRSVSMIALLAAMVVALAVALPGADAMARAGSSTSSGSRGSRTYDAPPTTSTAPTTASPFQRSMTPPPAASPATPRPNTPYPAPAQPSRGFFSGGGFMSGLMGGLIGAGIGSMLFGGGFFTGAGGFAGFLGFLLQIVLILFLVRLAIGFFRNRGLPGLAEAGTGRPMPYAAGPTGGGGSGGPRGRSDDVGIDPGDYAEFERLLTTIQNAYGNEDLNTLRGLVTPEMLSYFANDLAQNASRGVVNRIGDVRLLQGDLAEAWREGATDYATLAMRFALRDVMVDRGSGRVVSGDPGRMEEATEAWTFVRARGGHWLLSAIQQT